MGLYIYIFGWLSGGQGALKNKARVYIIYVEVKGEGSWRVRGFNVRMVLLLLIPEKRDRRFISYTSISHSCGMKKGGRGGNWAYARMPYLLRLLLQRMT